MSNRNFTYLIFTTITLFALAFISYLIQPRYETFIKKYWDICSGYIFFHYTYRDGSPNILHDIILDNVTGNPFIFDIVEPHKKRQGSITMVKKNGYV